VYNITISAAQLQTLAWTAFLGVELAHFFAFIQHLAAKFD